MKPVMGGMSALLVIFALTCSSQPSEALRILGLFPLNGKSHFVMSESLMRGLAEKGHQVDVYSHFPLDKPLKNYKDFSLKGSLPAIQNNMSYEYLHQFRSISLKYMFLHLSEPICDLMKLPVFQKLINNPPNDPPYDLLITELFLSECYLAMGRHLKIPTIGLVTATLFDWLNEPLGNPFNPSYVPSLFSGYSENMDFGQRLLNTGMIAMISAQYKYYGQCQDKYIEKYFGPGYPSAVSMLKDVSLALVNSHSSLNGIRAFTPAVIPVGGMHVIDKDQQLPTVVQKWLDESKHGFIYVSFGSMVRIETFPKEIQAAFYETFKKIAPVRVLFKIAKKEDLMPGLPENVMTYPWLPQIAVLKHKNVKAFLTHGGLMSTQESIYCGVPMIGTPLFGDQHLNIKSYVAKKIALKVDLTQMTEKSLTTAVKEIIENPIYKNNILKLSSEFVDRPMSPLATAIFWVEYVHRHPHALRSPIVEMPWWKLYQIDVYGLILLVLISALYVLRFVLRKVLCCVCSAKCAKANDKSSTKKKQ